MQSLHYLDNQSRVLLNQERKILYQLFSNIFYAPLTSDQLRQWGNLLRQDWLIALREQFPAFDLLFAHIEKEETEYLTTIWKEEYQSIFNIFNSSGKVQVPIWESYYTSSDHSLFSQSTFIMRNLLHDFNLQYKFENTHPDDHLSVEIEFLSYLIDYSQNALDSNDFQAYEKGILTQYWILKDHLLKWIPLFIKKIELANNQSIYFSISILLLEILKEDLDLVKFYKEEIENDEKII